MPNSIVEAQASWEDHKEEAQEPLDAEQSVADYYGLASDSRVWSFHYAGRRRWGCCPLLVEVERLDFSDSAFQSPNVPISGTGWIFAGELTWEDHLLSGSFDLETCLPIYGQQAMPNYGQAMPIRYEDSSTW